MEVREEFPCVGSARSRLNKDPVVFQLFEKIPFSAGKATRGGHGRAPDREFINEVFGLVLGQLWTRWLVSSLAKLPGVHW
jgi:hypothetical protein